MKTQKLNKNEYAEFMYKLGLDLKNYNYALIYDIAAIREVEKESIKESIKENYGRFNSNEPFGDTFYLFVREQSTSLLIGDAFYREELETYELFYREFTDVYKLEFVWNSEYFYSKESFCKLTKLK